MKLLTVLNKKFKDVQEYEHDKEDIITMYGLDVEEEQCEPSYILKVLADHIEFSDINGNLLKSGTEQEIKTFIKTMVI